MPACSRGLPASHPVSLESGLFASQSQLAVAIGVSHTGVRKAVQLATLPIEVITVCEPLLRPTGKNHKAQVGPGIVEVRPCAASVGACRRASVPMRWLAARVPRRSRVLRLSLASALTLASPPSMGVKRGGRAGTGRMTRGGVIPAPEGSASVDPVADFVRAQVGLLVLVISVDVFLLREQHA